MTDQPNEQPKPATGLTLKAPRPEVRAGGSVQAIVPRTLDEVYRLAQYMSKSGLAPSGMRSPEQITVAILAGAELGLPPFQAVQSLAVINGRPTLWGDALLATVLGRGVLVREWMEGEGEESIAHCEITRPDTKVKVERTFSVDDAKRAGLWMRKGRDGQDTPWVTYWPRMLQMRARSWAIRDGCADITRGIWVREEAVDAAYEDVTEASDAPVTVSQFLTADVEQADQGEIVIVDVDAEPEPEPEPEPQPAPPAQQMVEHIDPETGEVTEVPASPSETAGDVDLEAGEPPPEVEVKPQPSALTPTLKWITQVREAFLTTKTKADLSALDRRWMSDASIATRARLARDDPAMAKMLEAEYQALAVHINSRGDEE